MGDLGKRKLVARPDTLDFRDRMYEPALVSVPPVRDVEEFTRFRLPVLDQGESSACTGFALATVANFLFVSRPGDPDVEDVSPWMLYDMAKRYDEWEGEDYEGSSARGAMKGWHKHGVCDHSVWKGEREPASEWSVDAAGRPLGAYYRVKHTDLVAMHSAITEVGVLYATSQIHDGWLDPPSSGDIEPPQPEAILGGHAYVIVAYDEHGFWIQNSWGGDWAADGLARVSYREWLDYGNDVWVARLGVPVALASRAQETATIVDQPHGYHFAEMRPHIVAFGDDGELAGSGTYKTTPADLDGICDRFVKATESWDTRRLVFYAHGGLVGDARAVAEAHRIKRRFLEEEIYPIFFVWNTDWYSTLKNMLDDTVDRWRAEGPARGPRDWLEDRTDDLIEVVARSTRLGRAGWDEIKENGERATSVRNGAVRQLLTRLAKKTKDVDVEFHMVGHSAGSILLARLAQYLAEPSKFKIGRSTITGLGERVASVSLWAPAATMELADETYFDLAERGLIDKIRLFVLEDEAERDDTAGPYRKSILYLVSNALEARPRIPGFRSDGTPILGMEKFFDNNERIEALRQADKLDTIVAPTRRSTGSMASKATKHISFPSDKATLHASVLGIRS